MSETKRTAPKSHAVKAIVFACSLFAELSSVYWVYYEVPNLENLGTFILWVHLCLLMILFFTCTAVAKSASLDQQYKGKYLFWFTAYMYTNMLLALLLATFAWYVWATMAFLGGLGYGIMKVAYLSDYSEEHDDAR